MRSLLLFIIGACCLSISQAQVIHYVVQGGAGLKDGSSWQNASGSLQTIIDAAQAGDQLWVAKGVYYGPTSLNFNFRLKDGVSLFGGFAGTETAVDQRDLSLNITKLAGGYSSTDENIISGQAISDQTVIDGFLLTPDVPSAYCRGMYLINSSPVIRNCYFQNCVAHPVTKTHNGYGSGIFLDGGSNPKVINCRFDGNKALEYGGAVFVYRSAPQFINCSFINNSASSRGGGTYNIGSLVSYWHCVFQGNKTTSLSANLGGAAAFSGGIAVLDNCLFTNNQSGTAGAAIESSEAALTVNGCTISENASANATGGAAIHYSATGLGSVTISNSIIWNNLSTYGDPSLELPEIVAEVNSAEPIVSHNLIRYGQYTSLKDDPQFADPDKGNFQLMAASPAIDAGDNTAAHYMAGDTDLIGHNRIINETVDLGAYEAVTDIIVNNGDNVFKGFNGTLNVTGNAYENGLPNRYSWKMIVSGPSVNETFLADPADLLPYQAFLSGVGVTFDSIHFVVTDLSIMPAVLQLLTGTSDWDDFTGTILLSRVVYPNSAQSDSLLSNTETITIDLPLPVKITGFTGSLKNGLATLNWQTATETAFDRFLLEKSPDGKTFTRLFEFKATGDNSRYHTSVLQAEPLAYYRLKLINKDGSSSYYQNILALTQTGLPTLRVYPNPAADRIHVVSKAPATLVLYDATGKKVITASLRQGVNSVSITQLSKGVYFGQTDRGERFTFVKK